MKRIIYWIIVLAILGGCTYLNYDPKDEDKTQLSIYTDVYKYEESIRDHFEETRKLRKQYTLEFKSSNTAEDVDVILSSDYNKIDAERQYKVIGYTPLVVAMKDSDNLREYANKELLIMEKDGAEINFKKLIEAVIHGRSWSYFGGPNEVIKVYCPRENTSDGKLFYQFLLISINDGSYPHEEAEKARCKQIADQFLASKNVKQADMIERICTIRDIGNAVYVLPESDYYECLHRLQSEEPAFVAYPMQTVIKEVYYQANTPTGQSFDEDFEKTGIIHNSLRRYLVQYYTDYRTKENPKAPQCSYQSNTKDAFDYVEIPKDIWSSLTTK